MIGQATTLLNNDRVVFLLIFIERVTIRVSSYPHIVASNLQFDKRWQAGEMWKVSEQPL